MLNKTLKELALVAVGVCVSLAVIGLAERISNKKQQPNPERPKRHLKMIRGGKSA